MRAGWWRLAVVKVFYHAAFIGTYRSHDIAVKFDYVIGAGTLMQPVDILRDQRQPWDRIGESRKRNVARGTGFVVDKMNRNIL